MKSLLGKIKQNQILRLAASTVATLALASGISAANASTVRISTAKEVSSPSLAQINPQTTQASTSKPQYQAMQVELIAVVVIGGLIIFVPLFFGGLVVIVRGKSALL
jgi:hypothetical protein